MHIFSIPIDSPASLSIKEYLRRKIGLSLSSWRKLKAEGEILVNQMPVSPSSLLPPGSELTIRWFGERSQLKPAELPLSIVFEDDALLVIDKPAGILVHPSSLSDELTIANAVVHYFQTQNQYWHFHPVHRLDRNTSGLLIIAKTPHVQHLLSQNDFSLQRKYLALVEGHPTPPEGQIDLPIARHPDSIILRQISATGQSACTRYRTLQTGPSHSCLEIELLTGRTHQIRVHMSAIGNPLLGDDLYGGSTKFLARQALHSAYLSFPHPFSKKILSFHTPWPQDIAQIAADLLC